MRVFIGGEQFGHVREAFRRRGHYAYSCDLNPTRDGSPLPIGEHAAPAGAVSGWRAMGHHPDCTYFTNSAAWAYCDPDLDRFGIADDAGFVAPNVTGAVHGRHIRNLANRDPAQCRIPSAHLSRVSICSLTLNF